MAGVRVLVTPRAFLDLEGEHLAILKQAGYEIIANPRPRTLTEDEMAAYIVGMEGIIVGDDPVTHRVLDRATALKVISKFGTHVDNIDVDVAAARHIPVTFTPGVTHPAVAELTIGLMFALLRGIPQMDRDIRNGKWSSIAGVELMGKTLGIVGMGRSGFRLAERGEPVHGAAPDSGKRAGIVPCRLQHGGVGASSGRHGGGERRGRVERPTEARGLRHR